MARSRTLRLAATLAAVALAAGTGIGVAAADDGPQIRRLDPEISRNLPRPDLPTIDVSPSEPAPPPQIDPDRPRPQNDPPLERRTPDDLPQIGQDGGESGTTPERQRLPGADTLAPSPDRLPRDGAGAGDAAQQILNTCSAKDVRDPDALTDDVADLIANNPPIGRVVLEDGDTYDAYGDGHGNCVLIPRTDDAPGDFDEPAAPPVTDPGDDPGEGEWFRGCESTVWSEDGLPPGATPTGDVFRTQGGDFALFTDDPLAAQNCWLIPATDHGTTVERACTVYRLFTVADGEVRIPYGATTVPCEHRQIVETRYELTAVPSGPIDRPGSPVAAGRR